MVGLKLNYVSKRDRNIPRGFRQVCGSFVCSKYDYIR